MLNEICGIEEEELSVKEPVKEVLEEQKPEAVVEAIVEEEALELEAEQEEALENEDVPKNPFVVPSGEADRYNEEVESQEEYDVLTKKLNLRSDFIAAKIPQQVADMIGKRLFGYWTGSKLAKINPHIQWNPKSFSPGSHHLKRALHLVVIASNGYKAYKEAYLKLPFSHRVIGLSQIGCSGTFWGSDQAIDRFINDEQLKEAIKLDFEMPLDRLFRGQDSIEFLTHTTKDIRDETLFLVFDNKDGKNTKKIRERFPQHQIVTVVEGTGFDKEEASSLFSQPESELGEEGVLVPKQEYKGQGFYMGQTVFLSDLSSFYEQIPAVKKYGYLFGSIAIFAKVGPDYSGAIWGSSGGAEGAMRASRAMFGLRGPSSPADIAAAVSWADS